MEENFSYESGLKELEKLVSQLEKEELPLEKAILLYEKGIKISTQLAEILQKAQAKVKLLSLTSEGKLQLTEFTPEGEEQNER